MRLVKFEEEQQLVFAEVYAPGRPDSQGHFMKRETIRRMAHNFLEKQRTGEVNREHGDDIEAVVVESFLARDDDAVFIPGSWVAGVHIADPIIWEAVKTGEINGFSLEGFGIRETTLLEIAIPEKITVQTEPAPDGHFHIAELHFNEEGDLVEGRTKKDSTGHWHPIMRGTITEEPSSNDYGDHTHRFSFMEQLISDAS